MNLQKFQNKIGIWANITFPKATTESILAHLTEEIAELNEAKDFKVDLGFEIADCMMLLLHLAYENCLSAEDFLTAKFTINRHRKWNSTPNPQGYFKHTKETE